MNNKSIFTTNSSKQTQKLGEILAKELKGGPVRNASRSDAGGEIICLMGELGSGKTTFAQGVLKGMGAKGPYTSPTFVVMREYRIMHNMKRKTSPQPSPCQGEGDEIQNVYHIDAYRVGSKDILDLGWEEIIASKNNIIIVEWAERIRAIIPKRAIWLGFEHLREDERKVTIKSKFQNPNDKSNPKLK